MELVPEQQLDIEFGGDYHFVFDHAQYWKTLTEYVAECYCLDLYKMG
jgi:hypothetical protein